MCKRMNIFLCRQNSYLYSQLLLWWSDSFTSSVFFSLPFPYPKLSIGTEKGGRVSAVHHTLIQMRNIYPKIVWKVLEHTIHNINPDICILCISICILFCSPIKETILKTNLQYRILSNIPKGVVRIFIYNFIDLGSWGTFEFPSKISGLESVWEPASSTAAKAQTPAVQRQIVQLAFHFNLTKNRKYPDQTKIKTEALLRIHQIKSLVMLKTSRYIFLPTYLSIYFINLIRILDLIEDCL